MIIKEMVYIPIKLKHEFARAFMTTSDVNNQWRSNFQQQIISDNMKQPAAILVLPVLYTILVILVSRKYWLYQYCRYWKILENTVNTSIADTGRLGTKLRNVLAYCIFCPVCASVMRGRTVYMETGRKETRAGRKEKKGEKKREGGKVNRGGRNEKRGGRINSTMIKQDM
jgi:hypothetical protein